MLVSALKVTITMQKKCFNQKYGLEQAVLDGRKTMFRSVIKCPSNVFRLRLMRNCVGDWVAETYDDILRPIGHIKPAYKVGEVVAIAQSYNNIRNEYRENETLFASMKSNFISLLLGKKGWGNKMFVEAKFMPHHIKITDIKVERLQDISEEDCLKEGIGVWESPYYLEPCYRLPITSDKVYYYNTPREAFAHLINKVSSKGTWERNPWVFAYSFERVD